MNLGRDCTGSGIKTASELPLCGDREVSDRVIWYVAFLIPGPKGGTWGTQSWHRNKRSET